MFKSTPDFNRILPNKNTNTNSSKDRPGVLSEVLSNLNPLSKTKNSNGNSHRKRSKNKRKWSADSQKFFDPNDANVEDHETQGSWEVVVRQMRCYERADISSADKGVLLQGQAFEAVICIRDSANVRWLMGTARGQEGELGIEEAWIMEFRADRTRYHTPLRSWGLAPAGFPHDSLASRHSMCPTHTRFAAEPYQPTPLSH